jgi:type II secretory pathway pseudopilin PulG
MKQRRPAAFSGPRRGRRGVTLIEILLALIVMVLGFCGILALFPPALQSSTESVEETNAAILGESVAHALTNAIRFAQYNTTTQAQEVTLTHDLKAGGTAVRYKFTLPKLVPAADPTQGWKHYPGTVSPASPDPGGAPRSDGIMENEDRLFYLGGDNWSAATVQAVHDTNDPTDAYRQFAFCFDVRKVNTLEYLLQQMNPQTNQNYTLDNLETLCKLYEFRIHVYRTAGSPGATGSTPDVRKPIATVTKRIAAK